MAERKSALRAVLEGLFADGADLPARAVDASLAPIALPCRALLRVVGELEAPSDPARVRRIGLRLVREGTRRQTVWLGLALLDGTARAEDVETIRTVGLLAQCAAPALAALASLGAADDLVWLAERLERRQRCEAVRALTRVGGATARAWARRYEPEERWSSAEDARKLAELADLPDLLRGRPTAEALAHAGNLLCLMGVPDDYTSQLPAYAPARTVLLTLSRHASMLTETLAHRAVLASLALDVRSGPAFLLDWEPGERERVVNALMAAASSEPLPDPGDGDGDGAGAREERWRAAWLRGLAEGAREGGSDAPRPLRPPRPLRIHVAVRDPVRTGQPETRVLVDGRPVIAESFAAGPPRTPEEVLGRGLLRARDEPREVQLAEAYCTEGCCGALYVTVRREGDEVVWDAWRRPGASREDAARPLPPTLRFDAEGYDAEIARAETDRSWEWPARSFARRLAALLRERPEVLERWNCALDWITTHHQERDRVRVSLCYPARPTSCEDHWLQFLWDVDEDGTPPEAQARAALRRLTENDPTGFARLCGGNRAAAEALGFGERYAREG